MTVINMMAMMIKKKKTNIKSENSMLNNIFMDRTFVSP